MSVCNIAFDGSSVRFLTDTMIYRGDRPVSLAQRKAEVAPSGRFAWTCRGNVFLGDIIHRHLGVAQSMDDAGPFAAELMGVFSEEVMANCAGGIELTLAGWSDIRSALRILRLDRQIGSFTTDEIEPGTHLWPGSKRLPPLPATVTEEQFIKMALAQWTIQDKFDGKLCIGGVMHLTTVTRNGVEQRMAGTYPDYDKHAAAFGDPNADAVAQFRAGRRAVA